MSKTPDKKSVSTYVTCDKVPQPENPFLADLVTSTAGKIKSRTAGRVMKGKGGFMTEGRGLYDTNTGEILEDESMVVAIKKAVDTEEFVKVFTATTSALFELSKRANAVFSVLLKCYNTGRLDGTNDRIFFNYELAKENGYTKSEATFRPGLNELMMREFLVPSTLSKGWYWINPTLFYRGNRLTLINQYELSQEEDKKKARALAEKDQPKGDVVLDQMDFNGETERDRIAREKSSD